MMDATNALSSRNTMRSSPAGKFGSSMGLEDENPFVTPTGSVPPEGVVDSTRQSTHQTTSLNGTGKKRKNDDSIGGLVEMLAKMQKDTNARLDCLSLRIGYEFDLSKARKEVYDVLGRLPLTRDQKFDGGEIILEKVQHLDFFLGMPEEDMFAYAIRVLTKYG
ncbi:hypothetical protein SASPL_127072 [Salvia splendens]|uniref:Uncharacterized protein n=1 Tax=Salvia splendens TaxID=180675 RepID=A0A8X8XK67_SALSN|nr:hypothetical protein SASPL_127072 [Salvia splendens]